MTLQTPLLHYVRSLASDSSLTQSAQRRSAKDYRILKASSPAWRIVEIDLQRNHLTLQSLTKETSSTLSVGAFRAALHADVLRLGPSTARRAPRLL